MLVRNLLTVCSFCWCFANFKTVTLLSGLITVISNTVGMPLSFILQNVYTAVKHSFKRKQQTDVLLDSSTTGTHPYLQLLLHPLHGKNKKLKFNTRMSTCMRNS